MYIRTSGKPSKISISLCKKAARFYAEILLGSRLSKSINLLLEFKELDSKSNFIGFCSWEDINVSPKEFTITLSKKLGKRHTLLALAHEMVHVKQYAKNELKDYLSESNKVRWRGEKFDANEVDYWDQPWEIEAYGRELGLYARFKKNLKDECV